MGLEIPSYIRLTMGPNQNLKRFGVLYYSVYLMECQGVNHESQTSLYKRSIIKNLCGIL